MKAKDVMTRPVVSIDPQASVTDAAQLMLKNAISGLPVIDAKGELVGIVTEGDFLRRKETGTERARPRWLEYLVGPGRLAADYIRAAGRKVGDVMTREVRTIAEDAPLKEVVELIERQRIKRVPVVSGGKVVGIVSRANLLQALASVAGELKPGAVGDENIRERLLDELEKQSWVPLPLLNFIVRDGIVELWGAVTDERQRKALIVAAENVAGVKGVRDHLACIDSPVAVITVPPRERRRRSHGS